MKQVIGKAGKGREPIPTLVSILMLITIVASLICLGYPSTAVWAADFSGAPEFKLLASDGAANDIFGYSVAVSGDTAVVGARGDDVGANVDQGSAYVFVRIGTIWSQQSHLIANDGAPNDYFGWSVAISGDTAVIGAPSDNVGGNSSQGSAYVFSSNGTAWTQQAHLTAGDGSANDMFGYSVAISGDTVVVGAYADDVGANVDQGSAYVFTGSGTNWTEQAHLTASDGAAADDFGCSVAISGDTVIVGADGESVAQGSSYVFTRSGSAWTEQAKLMADDGTMGDNFGVSVAIDGDTAVVGAHYDDVGANSGQGSAYVFTGSGSNWTEQAQLTASDGSANDQFGVSVAIDGDTAVVGAQFDDVEAYVNQGSAYVFTGSGTNWTEQTQLAATDGALSDYFGCSVAISGDAVVVGAYYDDVGGDGNQGSAYVYDAGEHAAPAQVSATVTLTGVLISVTIPEGYPTAVDYGEMTLSAEAGPTDYIPDTYDYLRVENNGNVAENLLIMGASATCDGGTWVLAVTPGADEYSHLYGLGQTPGSYSPLSTSTSVLGTNVTVGGTVDFNVMIQTPTSSTIWGEYSTTVTVVAVAS